MSACEFLVFIIIIAVILATLLTFSILVILVIPPIVISINKSMGYKVLIYRSQNSKGILDIGYLYTTVKVY